MLPDPTCPLCERPIPPGSKPTRHHLTPRLKGGGKGPAVLMHRICHNAIHARFSEAELARAHFHLTARQAGWLAREAGARRLVLTHFSQRYPDARVFAEEAATVHDDVVAAEDFLRVPMPPRRQG